MHALIQFKGRALYLSYLNKQVGLHVCYTIG
jgi:hypothetical protein